MNKTKTDQDKFIMKHTSQHTPSRRRSIKGTRPGNSVTISYFIKTKKGMVSVCSTAFLKILGISRFRVQNLSRNFLNTGNIPKETRGGDKHSNFLKSHREAVKTFIAKLKCVECHYSREKSTRQYLPSDSNIKKLWKLYCTENKEFPVKYEFFRKVFVTYFNISFRTPATDACSECIRFHGLIQACKENDEKLELMTKFRVHKLKAKAFYNDLKTPENNTVKLSFDCQKNMLLPRVPDQSAYFSRQLYFYNFIICEGHSKSQQTHDTVMAYTWTENEASKGSNEITSMVCDKLTTLNIMESTQVLKMYCDGCPGQNKNVTMMGMLMFWLYSNKSSLKEVHVIFPIVGHSFLPPDRCFGRIEKIVRKRDTIIKPSEYRDIIRETATVKELGKDFVIYDWKKEVQDTIKPPGQWHFKFSAAKRIILKKSASGGNVIVRGEVNYKSDIGAFKSVLKRGKTISQMSPEPLLNQISLREEKLSDVDALLKKHFGSEWGNNDDLSFYKSVLQSVSRTNSETINEELHHFVEEDGLRI